MLTPRSRSPRRRLVALPALLAAGLVAAVVPGNAAAFDAIVSPDLTAGEAVGLGAPQGAPGGASALKHEGDPLNLRLFKSQASECQGAGVLSNRCIGWLGLEGSELLVSSAGDCDPSGTTALSLCQAPSRRNVGDSHLTRVGLSTARPYTIDLRDVDGTDPDSRLEILDVAPGLGAGVVYGGNSADRIISRSRSRDVMFGRGGNDLLQLGRAIGEGGVRNYLSAGFGNDTVSAFRNGSRDTVICSRGTDRAIIDLTDRDRRGGRGFRDCETRLRAPLDQHPVVQIAKKRVRVKRGRARVRLRCPGKATSRCKGRLQIKRGKRGNRTLGRARYNIRKGGKDTVRLRVRRGRGTARAIARETGPDGRAKISIREVKLRR